MPERVWFTIEDGLKARLTELALERGVSRDELAGQALAAGLTPITQAAADAIMESPSSVRSPVEPTLDDAADLILRHLPDHQRNLILDCCQETGRKPIEYLFSYIHIADERGETAMVMSEQMGDERVPALLRPEETAMCAFGGCRKSFTPTKRGQRFCPEPEDGSESCGRKATLEELHRRRPQRRAETGLSPRAQPPAPMQVDTAIYQRAAGLLEQAK